MDRRVEALAILDITDPVSMQEIKKAYRRLSLIHHPDKNGNSERSNTKFREITKAYKFLLTPAPPQSVGTGIGRMDVRIPPLVCELQLTLAQCYSGVMEPIVVERIVNTNGDKVPEREKIYVDIPEGIDDGEVITYKRRGHIVTGLGKGDLRIIIRVPPDGEIVRRGLDLSYVQPMTLRESLCGSSYELKHPSGRIVELKHSEGAVVSPDRTRSVKGLGMVRGRHRGDLHIRFKVIFPIRLTAGQVTKLKEIL